jgi:hypothetical protein
VLLVLIAEALGITPRPAAGVSSPDPWNRLADLAADPASGIAVRGKPPV